MFPQHISKKIYLNGSIINSYSLSSMDFREVQQFAEKVRVDISVLDSKGFYTTAEKIV